MADQPRLDGITLIDLAGIGPSARCVRALTDLGARWIRLLPPSSAGRPEMPWFTTGAFRGAEQVELDLKKGRDVFLRLVERADIVVEGMRPGVADRLGIGYAACNAVNPRIVYAAVTGYGQDGPYSNWVGHDINYQGVGGALGTAGRRADGAPATPGLSLADSAGGGWYGGLLVLTALVARQTTGRGAFLDVATAEGMVHLNSLFLDEYLGTGVAATAGNNILTGRYAWYDIYPTQDGKALTVGAIEPKFFANLCATLGLERFVPRQYEDAAQGEMRAAFAAVFKSRPRDAWMAELAKVDCCVGPVLATDEVVNDPHWRARNMFVDLDHPEVGRKRQVRPLGRGPADGRGRVPGKATDPDRILAGFGMAPAEIEKLKAGGVVR